MVTPAGLPAWTRTASPDIYGGISSKRNLGGFGAVNAKTDVTAEEYVRISGDLATCCQTAPLFWARLVVANPSGTATATVQQCSTQWSGPSGSYAGATPPSAGTWPTVTTGSPASSLAVSFPDLVSGTTLVASDAYGISGAFNIFGAYAGGHTVTLNADKTAFDIAGCTDDGEVIFLVVY